MGSNCGCCCTGFFGGVGVFASVFLGSGFLASSFFNASAIKSRCGSGGFFSTFAGGLGSGTGAGVSVEDLISFVSTTFAVGSSVGLRSATFSAKGCGFSVLAPFLAPRVICENSLAEMMSTGKDSSGTDSNALLENDTSPHPITRTCRAIDAASVLSTFSFTRLGSLLHFGHQGQPLEAGARQLPHHLRHRSVIGLLVRPHIYTLVHSAAGLGNGL